MENKSLLLTLITEVLGRPKKSNKHRGQYSFICPTCAAEKDENYDKAKLEVNVKRGVYKCWVCHETHNTHGSSTSITLLQCQNGSCRAAK